jgi:hypothetical protein
MGYNTAGITRLNSYAEAKLKYESVKPIRGHKLKVRPLCYREHHRMASIRMTDDGQGEVILEYYGRDLVVWSPDNTFVVNRPKYVSAFVPDNIHNYLPDGMFFGWNETRLTLHPAQGKGYLMLKNTSFRFEPQENGFKMQNPPKEFIYRKRPSMAKNFVANNFTPFIEWASTVFSITGSILKDKDNETVGFANETLLKALNLPSPEWFRERADRAGKTNVPSGGETPEQQSYREICMTDSRLSTAIPTVRNWRASTPTDWHTESVEKVLQWVTEPLSDNWAHALYLIMDRGGEHFYHRDNNTGESCWARQISLKGIADYLEGLVLHKNRDTMFITTELPDGIIPTRRNLAYFNQSFFNLDAEKPSNEG